MLESLQLARWLECLLARSLARCLVRLALLLGRGCGVHGVCMQKPAPFSLRFDARTEKCTR